jgi:hypothetical protein
VRFKCSLDGAAAVPCASPFETGRLDDGHHIFTVDAIDEAGRRDPTAATTAWTVDVAPPTAPTITGPTVVRGSRAVYRFSARDAATSASRLQFRCAVDSAALHLCAARFVARLNHGAHVLRVLAVDLAGNRSPAARRRIRVVP